jgi:hypothetical protein
MKIIPSITTSNFEITEIQLNEVENNSSLREFGLFLTGMHVKDDRMKLMQRLKDLGDCVIPLVHIRIDSTPEELDFCLNNFSTEWFNLHGIHQDVFVTSDIYSYRHYILAENSRVLTRLQLEHFAGICLDLSHYREDLLNRRNHFHELKESLNMYPIYCNHISSVRKDRKNWYSEHIGNYESDFDYLKAAPKEYWGTSCSCMELENSMKKQGEFIDYIRSIV